ncbi:hypothetical protein C8A03DRAFT_16575 [Achaetomium macrosporum]|uniref:Uncharacterized protein n=1 Tax=Achaetomium macrosporum TaxID=79813 RepID=A0AAN7C7H4_9PEZI|nr:hypothetical protein C8A03DRAFT_16575 [Achaetomium macrosporum]
MKQHRALVALAVSRAAATSDSPPLNITALSSRSGYSVLERWEPSSSNPIDFMSAVNYPVGSTMEAFWSRIKPRTYIGEAWASQVQLTVIVNGLVRITAPAPAAGEQSASVCGLAEAAIGRPETTVVYGMPGTVQSSILIAADLKSASTIAGHFTDFPSDEPTILVQMQFVDDRVPEHIVLHDGPCL